ncbi:MAG: 5-dehydro-2-deoxygluconokinase [Propionibacterium sp.]|nr:5-dehydro-2-deoxygluconokinase [Propionibacterium sp.]
MGLFSAKSLDVLTMGRIGVDIYPLQTGVGLQDVDQFGKFLGGSATNVAVAAARLGSPSAVVTGVGRDPFGRFCRRELGRLGVYDDYVRVFDGHNTPVTFCEIFPPDNFPLYFYRRPVAPDLLLTDDDLPADVIRSAKVFWITTTGLSAEPSRSTHRRALEIRGRAPNTVLDLDYRDNFWASPLEARDRIQAVLPHVTVAVGNVAECQVAVNEAEPERAAKRLLDFGVELAIVKDGPRGAIAMTRDRLLKVPATEVDVVNGLGAGDAFGGTLCHGICEGWELGEMLAAASAAGAMVASRLECSTAMPTEPELRRMLRDNPVQVENINRYEESND